MPPLNISLWQWKLWFIFPCCHKPLKTKLFFNLVNVHNKKFYTLCMTAMETKHKEYSFNLSKLINYLLIYSSCIFQLIKKKSLIMKDNFVSKISFSCCKTSCEPFFCIILILGMNTLYDYKAKKRNHSKSKKTES